jgi:hypothetical protein
MDTLIAFCGINCAECEAYKATQTNDSAWQERILAEWRVNFNQPEMPLAAVVCDGCRTPDGRAGGYCAECPVRACGVEHGVDSCAHCSEFENCQHLAEFYKVAPQVKSILEEIRKLM